MEMKEKTFIEKKSLIKLGMKKSNRNIQTEEIRE